MKRAVRWFRFGAANYALFLGGADVAVMGAMLSSLQEVYSLTHEGVSRIFIGQAAGFIVASIASSFVLDRVGLGWTLAIGATIQTTGYIVLALRPAFWIFVAGEALIGAGISVQDAQTTAWAAGASGNPSRAISTLYASYGLGAVVAPFAAQAIGLRKINHIYSLFALLNAINLFTLAGAFVANNGYTTHSQDQLREFAGRCRRTDSSRGKLRLPQTPQTTASCSTDPPVYCVSPRPSSASAIPTSMKEYRAAQSRACGGCVEFDSHTWLETPPANKLGTVLTNPYIWRAAAFLGISVGVNAAIGSWIVPFLSEVKHLDQGELPIAILWSGVTMGRLLLPPISARMGERCAVFVYLASLGGCQVILLTSNKKQLIDAVLFLQGLLLSPLYPIALSLITGSLPKALHSAAVGFLAAFAMSMSVAFPYLVGLSTTTLGLIVLQPFVLIMLTSLALLWAFEARTVLCSRLSSCEEHSSTSWRSDKSERTQ
ncbi:uncharacterized protein L969DRAFT_49719 [Mixia osmundae IAM 14324]|uniref:Major facilitator superfamily (MFS) profile domain-containing protein n=1 Tax=Mixia osmundae (strain CBS 9802 / IAM 14324 / JCM 22182 / KY 12970) TaxID=764103 RepID=G7E1W4_MIXOS|nr:uncharacterized protein L969DRAFT_49719 [Mixia osmundae IAM 14324]KEI38666.1 hypothetical protein L969DRAFT_49719 [Mixia osmundae IAM 14324]GAA96877.1 hypothetical protein E5Q_03550 [Mixia osmundae IAM 14324]